MKPIYIEATDLGDAWHQGLFKVMEAGREFKIDCGSYAGQKRLEFDYITVRIKYPDTLPLLPKVNPATNVPDPVEEGYLDDYLPYLMTGEEKEGESYTYGQRICAAITHQITSEKVGNVELIIDEAHILKNPIIISNGPFHLLNQMELMIWTYKNKGYRNNQMVLQVAQPNDMLLKDPPCLRHIDTRIQDGKLHFFPYFRSWDLYGGFPANLAAIEMMKQYCAEQIGVENGEIIASSKGLHIYDHVFEIAEALRGKTIEESRKDFFINETL